jgi:sortase A
MDTLEVDGTSYIGYLSIPALNLDLPVISEWSYPALKISPARYIESNQTHGLIIAGHNYSRHFGKLNTLTVGDPIFFTDVHDQVYSFKVSEIQILASDDMDAMVSGDWDLTLFTCTYGGANRVTVRCVFDKAA